MKAIAKCKSGSVAELGGGVAPIRPCGAGHGSSKLAQYANAIYLALHGSNLSHEKITGSYSAKSCPEALCLGGTVHLLRVEGWAHQGTRHSLFGGWSVGSS